MHRWGSASAGEKHRIGHILPSAECIRMYVKSHSSGAIIWGDMNVLFPLWLSPQQGGTHKGRTQLNAVTRKPTTIHSSPNVAHTRTKEEKKEQYNVLHRHR